MLSKEDILAVRQSDSDLLSMLTAYEEIEKTYKDILIAMGCTVEQTFEVKNSAEIDMLSPVTASTSL